jgi:hypothetical protein
VKTNKSTVKVEKFTDEFPKGELKNKIDHFTELFKKELKDLCNFDESEFNVGLVAISKTEETSDLFAAITFDDVKKAAAFYEEFSAIAFDLFKRQPIISIRVSE